MSKKFGLVEKSLIFTAVIVVLMAFYSLYKLFVLKASFGWGSVPIFDEIFTLILIAVFYKYRKNFRINNFTAVAGCIFLLLHNFGSFGPYDYVFFGILRYDKLLHFFGPFVLYMIVYDFTMQCTKSMHCLHRQKISMLAILAVLGVGAILEITEYFIGYVYGGQGVGIFFFGAGDEGRWNDSIWDMTSNLLGSITSAIVTWIIVWRKEN